MEEKFSKTIRRLISRSNKGDFSASFQLAQSYDEGFSVERDKEKAQHYLSVCASQLKENKFRIKSIKLNNYKGFEFLDLKLSKESSTTVLVGNNGCGKSTVLEAIKKCLTHLNSRLATKSNNGDLIEEIEIKNGEDFSSIGAEFEIEQQVINMELMQKTALSSKRVRGSYTQINDICQILRQANESDPQLSLPLFCSYTVERANDVTTKDIEESDEIKDEHVWNKAKAYSKSLSGKADFKLFFRWFKELIESDNELSSNADELRVKIQAKEKEINSPLLKELINKHPELEHLLDSHKKELADYKEQLNSIYTIDEKSLDIVKDAIYKFLPGFSDLKLQRKPLDLTLNKNGTQLSVLQLSQGEKTILALVADIARRLTLLNPKSLSPLEGSGIVLIDEIDLHLHPSWQQKIIQRLESTFPHIQFVVTTHSPQVCHTVDSSSIWLLKDGKKYRAPKGTRGAVSSWVLKNLFEVDVRPPDDEITQNLKRYRELVYDDKYDTVDALELKKQLSRHFGSAYEDLVQLDLYIDNRKWEKEYEEDQ
ncbi:MULTISPECIES: retron Ec78 anti-phage system effector ATPase PtuA [Vibrio]|nr:MULTISPECIES: retron Ec78 anti-phage system effector ATPase PtuA [Vibrio]MDF4656577.1 AAA family ATPase [Vibrio parahaemolyticus]KXZ34512.1 recombinase RecF [Vibrio alginolyticus]MDW2275893.1 retron Ec78 anti-phage system effector ATPase PtuA [Vibrio sp. 1074]MDW2286965.1 retron Ec78 anti-phage system effector ATPase PtuA [Vibrio sp. 1562]HCG7073355.1 AAA family ATPase [Vibrio parahaemolyticus]